MSEQKQPLMIHSFAEAHLFLMVVPCNGCGGAVSPVEHRVQHDRDAHVLTVPVVCRSCGQTADIFFETHGIEPEAAMLGSLANVHAALGLQVLPPINPTDEPSRVIDVAGWLTLYAVVNETAQQVAAEAQIPDERRNARQMLMQASQCLDEALKFYDADNDLPPEDAFFWEESRQQFRDRPALFTRQRLIDLRAKLPVQHVNGLAGAEVDKSCLTPSDGTKQRWWRRRKT